MHTAATSGHMFYIITVVYMNRRCTISENTGKLYRSKRDQRECTEWKTCGGVICPFLQNTYENVFSVFHFIVLLLYFGVAIHLKKTSAIIFPLKQSC